MISTVAHEVPEYYDPISRSVAGGRQLQRSDQGDVVKYFSRLDCVQSRMCDVLDLDVMNDLGCVDSGVEIGLLQVRKMRIYVAPATVKGT